MKVFLIGLGIFVVFVFIVMLAKYFWLWIRALTSGARVTMLELIGMSLRKVNANVIITSRIAAVKAGLALETSQLEAHYLAGGNVPNVVRALIKSYGANLGLNWEDARKIDLAGRDILGGITDYVTPRVIDCPDPTKGKSTLDAVAKDGIQLKATARITVRTNIPRLVGGATSETVIARVGEGIVSTIGSSESYKVVLENPDNISRTVLGRGLESETAYHIVSVDIRDVDVGENIGAQLQARQAETNMKIAQAQAETRRAMAVALEQENRAKVMENRALVVLAEAEVPRAMAQAFREGNLGLMDYYRMKNIQADTQMRDTIGGGTTEQQ